MQRLISALLSTFAALLLVPGAAGAVDVYDFKASLLAGIGGAIDDVEPDPGFQNFSLQLGFAVVSEPETQVGIRLGRTDFGSEALGSFSDAELSYINVAGEHTFPNRFYVPGIYLGVGLYRLEGDLADGGSDSETSIGAVLGYSGEFAISRKLGVLVELSGHYTDLGPVRFFGLGQVGLAYHF